MSFGGSGGGSSSIATSTDVALNNPADGQVLTYNGSLAKWQNQATGAAAASKVTAAYAWVEQAGSSIIAHLTSDGSIISQGSDAATVINAALVAASNNGLVQLNAGTYLCSSPVILKQATGLIGCGTFSRTNTVFSGSVLQSNGLGAGQAVVQSGGDGGRLIGIAVNANNQADYAFAHLLGADVNVTDCVLGYANNSNLYHNTSTGSYAFVMQNCELWYSGNYGINIAAGTDGRILNCGVYQSANICVSIRAGGWLLSGCHITHSSTLTTTINTEVTGSICTLTGNYFDTCKNGPTVRLAGAGITFVSNFVYNSTSNNGGTLAIALDSAFGAHVANNTTQTNAGTGMQWRSGGLPVSGIYGPNFHLNSSQGYVDSSGNAVPVQTTSTLYVGPNLTS